MKTRQLFLAVPLVCLALAQAAQADTADDVRRSDMLSLHRLSFLYSIPGTFGPSVYSQSVEQVCLSKAVGTLDFTLNPADLGFPDLNIPIRFRGTAMADGRIRWTAEQPVNQCFSIAMPGGGRQSVFVGGTNANLEVTAMGTGPVPTVDCGRQRHSLVAISPDTRPGVNRINFDANANCPPGLFGGTVGVFQFEFIGHFSIAAPPPAPPPPNLSSLTLDPNHFCQFTAARSPVAVTGRIGLDRAATAPVRVTLTASRGITLSSSTIDVPAGANRAEFVATLGTSFGGNGGVTAAAGTRHAYASVVMDLDPAPPDGGTECRAWSVPWIKVVIPPKLLKRPWPDPDPEYKKFIKTLEAVNQKAVIRKATDNVELSPKGIKPKAMKMPIAPKAIAPKAVDAIDPAVSPKAFDNPKAAKPKGIDPAVSPKAIDNPKAVDSTAKPVAPKAAAPKSVPPSPVKKP